MKWLVAGAGALLTLVGLYFLLTGYSIVQVERGWAMFIVGGTLFSAGSLLMGMAALIARLDAISVAQSPAPALEPAQEWPASPSLAPPIAAAAAVATAGLAASMPELRPEPKPAAAPVPEPAPEPEPEPKPEPKPEPVAETVPAPAVELPRDLPAPAVEPPSAPAPESPRERPEALRNFTFVFPPIDTPELLAPAKSAEPEVRLPDLEPFAPPPPPAPAAEPKSGLLNLSWLRRAKPAAPVPAPEPEPLPEVERAPEPVAIIEEAEAFAAGLEQAAKPAQTEAEPEDRAASIEPEPDLMPAPSLTGISLPPPPRAEEPPVSFAEKTPEPFSDDWLERALAGDEPREPPPPRFIPPSMRRAALEEARQDEAEQMAAPPVEEPVASAPALSEAPESAEIGRYKAGDVSYIMYADGSIAAETANGTFRFSSLIELKDFIERGA